MSLYHDIVVVGGGASGTIVATQLLLQAETPLQLCCVEPGHRLGAGLAYGRCSDKHVLNVPANRISAMAGDAGHFLHWLQQQQSPPQDPGDFYARRQLYADYLADCLQQALHSGQQQHQFTHQQQMVIAMQPTAEGWQLRLDDNRLLKARQVVLALGNLPAARPPGSLQRLLHSDRYLHDPWRLQQLQPDRAERIAIIGSGLTALDTLQTLIRSDHRGAIEVFSRSGQWPTVQTSHRQAYPFNPRATRLRELVREIRTQIKTAQAQDIDWRNVIDGLRPHTQALWSGFSETEKSRFRRYLLSTWNRHRHRIPPRAAQQLQQWEQAGRFSMSRARRLEAIAGADEIRLRSHDQAAWSSFQLVINATGPCGHLSRAVSPLLQQLLADAVIRSGPCNVGVDSLADGQIIGPDDQPVAGLYAIGPLRQGTLLETTAMPEIKLQAQQLAAALLH